MRAHETHGVDLPSSFKVFAESVAAGVRRIALRHALLLVSVVGVALAVAFRPALSLLAQSQGGLSVGIDIRSDGALAAVSDVQGYVAAIDNCTRLTSVTVVGAKGDVVKSRSEAVPLPGWPSGCQFPFLASGPRRLAPTLSVRMDDGSVQTHGEVFAIENAPPNIQFQGVSMLRLDDGAQALSVSLTASDDTDLQLVRLKVIGLRASELRAAGGIIERARVSAFAETKGAESIFPGVNGQKAFSLTVPVKTSLSPAEIASNGVVIIEAAAVDASGNETSLSKIALTGADVTEGFSALQVAPSKIVFGNLLQTATLIPSVDYQFRGRTPLPGAGGGVRYISNHPELVSVTKEGVVVPLAQTKGQDVTITVQYSGLTEVVVPVVVDPNMKLVKLKARGLDDAGHFVIPRLNSFVSAPTIVGVFDDAQATEVEITEQFPLIFSFEAANAVEFELHRGFRARAAVPASNPLVVSATLSSLSPTEQRAVAAQIPLVAIDALPTVGIVAPSSVKPDESLTLKAVAEDDVGVTEVRFLSGDAVLGIRKEPPFEITAQIGEQRVGSVLTFRAEAYDTLGQHQSSIEVKTTITEGPPPAAPEAVIESPMELQRVVENTKLTLQVAHPFDTRNPITSVEFQVDGQTLRELRFPVIETRLVGGLPTAFEVFRLESAAKSVTTGETTSAIHAIVHDQRGGVRTLSRLFKVVKNRDPIAKVVTPLNGTPVAVGQNFSLNYQVLDDSVSEGVSTELELNGKVINSARLVGTADRASAS